MNTSVSLACRGCGHALRHLVVDLGDMPLANRFLTESDLARPEPKYPLRVWFCDSCYLVQAEESASPEEIFSDYAYFSSYSSDWLQHARDYCDAVSRRFSLGATSRVIEVASNDGYLLRNFVAAGIPCLGIEPAENVAATAREAGIPTRCVFLGAATAKTIVEESGAADLVVANNVLAHTPFVNDLTAGLRTLLKPGGGVLTVEFPHLMQLVAEGQFDTIYHEHFSYFSLAAIERLFARHELRVFDVDHLRTHGGSLRVYAERSDSPTRQESDTLRALRTTERDSGVTEPRYYGDFRRSVEATIASVRQFLAEAARAGRSVAAYGAAAKGNTLLNACRVTPSEIAYAVDRNPYKQGRYLPGTHLPVFAPQHLAETRPDYVFILPWNLKAEIMSEWRQVWGWGGRFVVPIPKLEVLAS